MLAPPGLLKLNVSNEAHGFALSPAPGLQSVPADGERPSRPNLPSKSAQAARAKCLRPGAQATDICLSQSRRLEVPGQGAGRPSFCRGSPSGLETAAFPASSRVGGERGEHSFPSFPASSRVGGREGNTVSHVCLQGHGPSRGSSFTTIQAPRPPNTVALGARLSAQTGHGLRPHPRRGQPFGRLPSLPLRSRRHSASPPVPGLPRVRSTAHGPASPILSLSLYILPRHSDWRLSPMSASPMGTAHVVPGPLGNAEKVPRTFAESHFALI